MLRNEFQRHGIELDVGTGICTYRLSGEKLSAACARFGIEIGQQHRALADARAAAELLRVFADDVELRSSAAQVGHVPFGLNTRTLRPERLDGATNEMVRVVSHARYPCFDEAILHYLDALDWVLDDHIIDEEERAAMSDLGQSYGLSNEMIEEVHRAYLASIIAAARGDGMITDAERELIEPTKAALMIDDVEVPQVTELPAAGTL